MYLRRYRSVNFGVIAGLCLWGSLAQATNWFLTLHEKQPSILRISMQANTYIQFWGSEPITELKHSGCESLTAGTTTQGSLWPTGYVKISPKTALDQDKTYTCHYSLGTRREKFAALTLIIDPRVGGQDVTLITADHAKLLKQQTPGWNIHDGYDNKFKSWWKGLWD